MREIKGMEQVLLCGAAQAARLGSLKCEENRDYYNAL